MNQASSRDRSEQGAAPRELADRADCLGGGGPLNGGLLQATPKPTTRRDAAAPNQNAPYSV